MATFRILSLDGGGLRGLITARLLQRLNAHPEVAGFLDDVDLIAGTSTGGILALALAAGHPPEDICGLYLHKGAEIFNDSIWDNIRDLGRTVGAEYSNKTLRRELDLLFADTTLAELGRKVTIPTFDLDNEADSARRSWKPKIFHNFIGSDSDGAMKAADVAMYTSAAPTYFPSVDGYIDGGVFANNPSMVAIAQAISARNHASERATIDQLVMLSVGTGVSLSYIKGQRLDWGYAQWIKPLINVLMEGVAGIADYQSAQLLDQRYHRLQIVFDPRDRIALDDAKKLQRMDDIAWAYDLEPTAHWVATHWQ